MTARASVGGLCGLVQSRLLHVQSATAQSPSATTGQTTGVVAAEGVSAGYPDRPLVLRNVSVSAVPGEVLAVIGANGAGKSTLLRVLLGTLAPGAGRVLLHGRDVGTIPVAERARLTAYIAQRPGVTFGYSALEVVQLGCPWLGGSAAQDAALRALSRVGLADRAQDALGALSVGQQQRVSLARALAQIGSRPKTETRAPVLLADEPVAAMDPAHALETLDTLQSLAREGAAVIVVLHDVLQASRFADRLLLLNADGTPAASGAIKDVLRPELLESVYGVEFSRLGNGVGMLPTRLLQQ